MEPRSFAAAEFGIDRLLEAKGPLAVSVCLPARNEEPTIGEIVATIRKELMDRNPLVDELVVVDDGSQDATREVAEAAGARVISVRDVLVEEGGDYPGKGQAMWKGLYVTRGDIVVYLDSDVRNFHSGFVTGLLGPLLLGPPGTLLVKAYYSRPLNGQAGEGGRVTELVARPALALLDPALARIKQPLAGETAAFRFVLERLPFCDGYGVEVGLLIDFVRTFGISALAEVDLGERIHRNRSLSELSPQALGVLATIWRKAGLLKGLTHVDFPVMGGEIRRVGVGERRPLIELEAYKNREYGLSAWA